eukprot:CAMPEP_0117577294 /NCGR_PEP_ID=MMETSP0784-20121206/63337_1 /TAXON_ID=39447 /ORGANISM="" /LENGTH=53 /DNA_ID=CAMNT_0005376769 /DNA_START=107 /DNA_END=265 /DNA_ORIENTATION=+
MRCPLQRASDFHVNLGLLRHEAHEFADSQHQAHRRTSCCDARRAAHFNAQKLH